jgi:hypothetical protein
MITTAVPRKRARGLGGQVVVQCLPQAKGAQPAEVTVKDNSQVGTQQIRLIATGQLRRLYAIR